MLIDINRGGEKLVVNLDIYLPNMPCDLLSIDVQNVIGTYELNVEGSLVKKRFRGNEFYAAEAYNTTLDGQRAR